MVFPLLSLFLGFSNLFFFLMFIFEGERETEHEWGRGRKREIQNPKWAPGSELSAQSLMWAQTHKL